LAAPGRGTGEEELESFLVQNQFPRLLGRSRAQIYLIRHRVTAALKKVVRRLENPLG
jgi:hypothetical protein